MPSPLLHLIFVYGTLQRGENNYIYWLADPEEAVFVGRARTASRYPLFVILGPEFPSCSPCLLNLPEGDDRSLSPTRRHQVEGELFLVTPKMKAWLDILEEVHEGVYVVSDIAVEILERPSAHSLSDASLEAFRHPTSTENVLRAEVYFRSKGYPDDWASQQPRNSSALMQKFSAEACLEAYGTRFIGGIPAHLRSGGGEAKGLQQRLNDLPAAYWPPSTLEQRKSTEGALDSTGTPYFHGAPLFPKPLVLFIIDGVGDNTYPELGNRTPLEVVAGMPPTSVPDAACMPVQVKTLSVPPGDITALLSQSSAFTCEGINCVSCNGASGLMDPYMAGMSCGSDTAHLSMFGYPPEKYYRGRGAYEALGAGLMLDDEDVAFKSNFATFVDPDDLLDEVGDELKDVLESGDQQFVAYRRCDRNFMVEGPVLCEGLNGITIESDCHGGAFDYPHVIKVHYATEHRCGVALSGARVVEISDGHGGTSRKIMGMLSDKITGTDPLRDNCARLRCTPTVGPEHEEYAAAMYTCRLVEAASHRITTLLKQHPINEARRRHNRQNREKGSGEAPKAIANLILFRGAAKKGWIPSFLVRHGLRSVILSPTCIIKGIGLCCGIQCDVCPACFPPSTIRTELQLEERHPLEGATGDCSSNLDVKVDALLHALRLRCPPDHDARVATLCALPEDKRRSLQLHPHYNMAVLHVKGVDDSGHDGSLPERLCMLQRCGRAMRRLWDALPEGATMAVVADHSTPLAIRDHSCEPVPVAVATKKEGLGAFHDQVCYYSEREASYGALGRFRGEELIPLMKRANTYYHYL